MAAGAGLLVLLPTTFLLGLLALYLLAELGG